MSTLRLEVSRLSGCDAANVPVTTGTAQEADARELPLPRRRVLVFRKLLLPLSETFILDQFSSYRDWVPTLLGYEQVAGVDLGGVSPVTVAQGSSRLARLRLKFYQHVQFLGHVPPSLLALVEAQRPDLIHAHFGYDAILIWDVARRLRLPLVVTLHGDDILRRPEVWRSGSQGQFFRLYPRKLRRLFEDETVHFIAVSYAVAERAITRGAARDRVHVRYTGTRVASSSDLATRERERSVLFVGRLVEFKGCEFLIRAMALVQRDIPEARLIVVGDGPLRRELQGLAAQLGVAADFLGAVERAVVRAQMAAASVFCLPSITDSEGAFEAFGMVIVEAMASHLAVVTSAKGGGEAIRQGETGFLVAEGGVTAMAGHIATLMKDDVTRRRVARQARAHVEAHFALDACTARIEQLYDAILAGRP